MHILFNTTSIFKITSIYIYGLYIQPVSYKRYFRCNNCFLLLVYTINLSQSTDLVDPPPMGTFYMKHALANRWEVAKAVLGISPT